MLCLPALARNVRVFMKWSTYGPVVLRSPLEAGEKAKGPRVTRTEEPNTLFSRQNCRGRPLHLPAEVLVRFGRAIEGDAV